MIKTNSMVAVGLLFTTTAAFAGPPDIKITEIRIDHVGSDINEYFELAGEPGQSLDDLTYIVIGDFGTNGGVIDAAVDLTGHSINDSGFFLVAESTFTLGPPAPDLTLDLDFENSDNVTHLLVAGFAGAVGDDLDIEDDCVLNSTPWTSMVDLIALIEEENPPDGTECHYGPPTIGPNGDFVPSHVYLCVSLNLWQIGDHFDLELFDTPGEPNPECAVSCLSGGAAPDVELSEIRTGHLGPDVNEYFELAGVPFTSLDGVAYVVLGDGSEDQGSGVIEEIVCLNEQLILGDGFIVVAEEDFELGIANVTTPLNFEGGYLTGLAGRTDARRRCI